MPGSRELKNTMRSAKGPKMGTCAPGDESKSNMRGTQYNQNKTTPAKAKSYGPKGSNGGSAGKLII